MRAYPPKYSPKLGISVVRPKAAPPGLKRGGAPSERCCFTVQCGEVSHVLAADSPELAQRWIDKLNKAWLHYTESSTRRVTATTSSERHAHERESLRGEVERFRLEARETRVEAAKREDVLRQEVHQAVERARRMESMVEDRTAYTVWVHTGAVKGAGTSAKVTVNLLGSHERSSGDMPLEATGENRRGAFDRGAVSKFTFECGYVGDVHSVVLGHDGSGYHPSWYVEKVKVQCDRDRSTWYFPVGQWFDVHCHDGATHRELPAPAGVWSDKDARGSSVYLVTTYTSDVRGAGTDANVSMVIHGAKGDTGPMRLAKGRDDFVRGARDQFVLEGPDVGEIRHIVIGHDNAGHGPSWHLRQVEIRCCENRGGVSNKLIVFPCNEWFEDNHGDALTRRSLVPDDPADPQTSRAMVRHVITVFTSDVPSAATDAVVTITLNGERGSSGPHELSAGKNDFSRGAEDVFPLDIQDVGAITSVVMSQDGRGLSPGWHLDQVVVLNKTSGAEYAFVCKGWVEATGGAGQGASILLEATSGEAVNTRTAKDAYRVEVITSDVRGAGTGANVFFEMFGSDGRSSGKHQLVNDSKSCFERGTSDSFVLRCRDLGLIDRVVIGRDRVGEDQGWHLSEVIVQKQDKSSGGDPPVKFIAGRWLNSGGGGLEAELFPEGSSRAPERNFKYHVTVNTSKQKGAGTDANVSLKLTGKSGTFGPVQLESGGSSAFERAGQDVFLLDSPDLGDLVSLNIGHDASGGGGYNLNQQAKWLLDSVVVQAMSVDLAGAPQKSAAHARAHAHAESSLKPLGPPVVFPYGKWLKVEGKHATGEVDPGLRVDLFPAGVAGAHALLARYTVAVQTSDLKGAGTDANVYVVLIGAGGEKTEKLALHAAAHDDFERGQRDVFILEVPDVGEVEQIEIGHDGTSAKSTWHLDHVEVTREDQRRDADAADTDAEAEAGAATQKQEGPTCAGAFFPAGRWLAAGTGDGQTKVVLSRGVAPAKPAAGQAGEPSRAYKVVVHTSDLPGAGTDASVFLVLHGEHGDSLPCPLTAAPGRSSEIFERGSDDHFELRLPGVGKLRAVTIGHDCRGVSPDWHVDTIEVTDVAAASAAAAPATSYFHVGAWIEAGGRGSGEKSSTMRVEGSADGVDPRAARTKYVVAVKTADVRGAGTDSPVFIDIHGTRGGKTVSTGPLPLRNNNRNAFDRGASDKFDVPGPDMDVITHIRLGHSSSVTGHGWHPAGVEVRGFRASHYTTFTVGRFIPVEGKGLVLLEFRADETPAPQMISPADGAGAGATQKSDQTGKMGKYRVTVKTSDVRGASTDADAFIVIGGGDANAVTGPHPLDAKPGAAPNGKNHGHHHLFQRDQKDVFEIEAPLVGDPISLVEISHNSRGRPSGWCIEYVHVEELTTGIRSHFAVGDKWLFPSEKGAGTIVTMKVKKTATLPLSLEKPVPTTYRVVVYTSDFRAAGTDASVYVVFHGETGDSPRVALDNSPVAAAKAAAGEAKYDLFERNSEDVFVVNAPGSIGRLSAITVGHDGGGNQGRVGNLKDTWHLNYVEVIELLPEDAKVAAETFRRGDTPQKPAKSASPPLYFTCKQWLGWSAEDKKLERRLPASIANPSAQYLKVDYVVIVRTGNERGAGTDASVRVALRGPKGATSDLTLTQAAYRAATEKKIGNQNSNNSAWFERGSVDAFILQNVRDVGEVEHLTLSHDGRGHDVSWLPLSVQIRRLSGGDSEDAAAAVAEAPALTTFTCPGGRYINTTDDRLELLPSPNPVAHADHTYTVKVTTADEHGASTDADVYVILRGMVEQLPKRILYKTASGQEPFQRGATDVFTMTGPGVGEMVAVEVGHDNRGHGPSWKMMTMEITDETAGPGSTRYFHCNEWFDADVGDTLIRRTIPSNGSKTPPWEMPGHLDASASWRRNPALGNSPSTMSRSLTLDDDPPSPRGSGGGGAGQGSLSEQGRSPSPVEAGGSGGLNSLASVPAPAG